MAWMYPLGAAIPPTPGTEDQTLGTALGQARCSGLGLPSLHPEKRGQWEFSSIARVPHGQQ